MKYWLHPEAEVDLRDAAEFYRERGGPNLSRAFLVDLKHSANLLARYPRLGVRWRVNTRKLVLSRFPYSVIYSISGEGIRILAVASHSRKPGYWRNRK